MPHAPSDRMPHAPSDRMPHARSDRMPHARSDRMPHGPVTVCPLLAVLGFFLLSCFKSI